LRRVHRLGLAGAKDLARTDGHATLHDALQLGLRGQAAAIDDDVRGRRLGATGYSHAIDAAGAAAATAAHGGLHEDRVVAGHGHGDGAAAAVRTAN